MRVGASAVGGITTSLDCPRSKQNWNWVRRSRDEVVVVVATN